MRVLIASLVALMVMSTGAIAAKMGEDGLHKQPWFSTTFKDVKEDLETAKQDGKRLAIIIEQRGCIYCKKLHETVFSSFLQDERLALVRIPLGLALIFLPRRLLYHRPQWEPESRAIA